MAPSLKPNLDRKETCAKSVHKSSAALYAPNRQHIDQPATKLSQSFYLQNFCHCVGPCNVTNTTNFPPIEALCWSRVWPHLRTLGISHSPTHQYWPREIRLCLWARNVQLQAQANLPWPILMSG